MLVGLWIVTGGGFVVVSGVWGLGLSWIGCKDLVY